MGALFRGRALRWRRARTTEERRRLRLWLLAGFLGLSALTYARQAAAQDLYGWASDFRTFFVAAAMVGWGDNPYSLVALSEAEAQLFGRSAPVFFLPYVSTPLFAWALQPLARLPFGLAYGLWAAFLAGAAGGAAWLLMSLLGWQRWRGRTLALFMLSSITFLGLFWGQPSALLLLALVGALWLVQGGRPAWAGVLLGLAWLKPHLLLPVIAAWFFLPADRRAGASLGLGFVGCTLAGLGLTWWVAGPSLLGQWMEAMAGFGQAADQALPDISSLPGLYISWLPRPASVSLTALLWAGAIVYAVRLLRHPASVGSTAYWHKLCLLLTLWLLVTPYTHPNDDILLLLPTLFMVGRDFRGLERPPVEAAILALCLLPQLYPTVLRALGLVGLTGLAVGLVFYALAPLQAWREAGGGGSEGRPRWRA